MKSCEIKPPNGRVISGCFNTTGRIRSKYKHALRIPAQRNLAIDPASFSVIVMFARSKHGSEMASGMLASVIDAILPLRLPADRLLISETHTQRSHHDS